jgi:TatA/E family protein of Tat protein translocase
VGVMLEHIGKTEIIIVALVLLILFGPKKLPEFARGLAESIKEVFSAFHPDKTVEKTEKTVKTESKKS